MCCQLIPFQQHKWTRTIKQEENAIYELFPTPDTDLLVCNLHKWSVTVAIKPVNRNILTMCNTKHGLVFRVNPSNHYQGNQSNLSKL